MLTKNLGQHAKCGREKVCHILKACKSNNDCSRNFACLPIITTTHTAKWKMLRKDRSYSKIVVKQPPPNQQRNSRRSLTNLAGQYSRKQDRTGTTDIVK